MRSQLLSFSCALLGGFWVWRVDASCFYPDGTFPDDYVYTACSGDEFTSCCILTEGDQCLSNGLCYSQAAGYMFRGACTDKTWNSENCFQHCKGTLDDYSSSSWDQLVHCGEDRYCCYSDGSTCCNDDTKVFTVESASVIKDLSSTTSYSLPIEQPTATAGSGSKTRSTKTGTTATTATSTAEAEASTEKPASGSSGTSKTVIIACAAAGVAVLIIAIALVWFFVRRRYRKKLAAGSNPQSYPMSGDGFQKLPDKSPRPVEVPAPLHSPMPPPAYQPPQHGAVEIDSSYRHPGVNQWGQPVYEAPVKVYR
ncbi:hypothetical protein BU26DRAFT_600882 [Trematosphaeria pertusa]|uniref:Mid2 domain-containing protein n=1 Tax=Trematosphaeria pertusa TaxID=390896 RepID=A0A6A6IZ79_9PLEO|nr:uncharacterized protein BU26DRAFT_600882 [Trematosphaeria pertusa]KAF2255367.1 hypothetical protein BU26DRAFT_600882 [Trematosphaeria pertusa]